MLKSLLLYLSLSNDMINKVPSDFWSSNLPVFDPCCGKGVFTILLYTKLMNGLESKIQDKKERRKHILENLIYFSDINESNIYITKFLLDPFNEYKLRYNIGDTLEINIKEKWDIEGYGLVIGNPPYNSTGGTNTGNTIWQNFVKKALSKWIIKKGYLVFIHPPGWRKPNSSKGRFNGLFNLMTSENYMLYLEIHNTKDGKKVFNAGTRYDWYTIQKINKNVNTEVLDEKNIISSINMKKIFWLPNFDINIIEKLTAENKEEKCKLIYSPSAYEHRKKWMSKIKDDEFKFICVHSTPQTGVRYMYSSRNDNGHFGIKKIIFGEAGIHNCVIDIDGIYGLTNRCIGIEINNIDEGKKYKEFLESNIAKNLLSSCCFSSFRVDWNIFKDMKKNFWKEFI